MKADPLPFWMACVCCIVVCLAFVVSCTSPTGPTEKGGSLPVPQSVANDVRP